VLKILLNTFATILALSGYLITYVLNKGKLRRYRLLLGFVALLAPALIWGEYIYQDRENKTILAKFSEIKTQYASLLGENDTLSLKVNQIIESNRELLGYLEPFREIWVSTYPGLSPAEASAQLATDLYSKKQLARNTQSEIILLDDRIAIQRAPNTGLTHTRYVFRSRQPYPLRDIYIKLRFDGRILNAIGRLSGAVVFEQGSEMLIHSDSCGLTYFTGYLSESNDIVIEVVSHAPLNILSSDLSP
jgi:hypothetical protein